MRRTKALISVVASAVLLTSLPLFSVGERPSEYAHFDKELDNYFRNFESLAKEEKWVEILMWGKIAIESAQMSHRSADEAKICAQLTSTAFYMGEYHGALAYARRARELSEKFDDPSLFLRALYLESAAHRALAAKEETEESQQAFYARAVQICEEASNLYSLKNVENLNLKGKIYFNWGAAYADNPKGDLEKAANCYSSALECYKNVNATDDVIRTMVRLGKVHLLRNNTLLCQNIIDAVRPLITTQRISLQADYLEAQLKLATHDFKGAQKIAADGLRKSEALGAKEDVLRFRALLQKTETHS